MKNEINILLLNHFYLDINLIHFSFEFDEKTTVSMNSIPFTDDINISFIKS
jgi:hypothetical protein